MTPQDKIFSLSELDGLKPKIVEGLLMAGDGAPIQNYLASYDAIIPLIQKQPQKVRFTMSSILLANLGITRAWQATPTQLCNALLRATGKMKK